MTETEKRFDEVFAKYGGIYQSSSDLEDSLQDKFLQIGSTLISELA